MSVRPAKTQISLDIRQSFNHVDSEDFDQTDPGWSDTSLCAQPFCWFCHVAAHIASKDCNRVLKTNLDQNTFTAYDSV